MYWGAGVKFRLNRKGGSEVLRKMAAGQVNALADRVASQAGRGVYVDKYTTDRAAAEVGVPAALQAKYGTLTRAASAAGLEVHPK